MKPTEPAVLHSVRELQSWADGLRAAGRRIALVPTMGSLHEGHLSLVRLAHQRADRVVVSLFVNPTQFGLGEDFDSYPRELAADLVKLRKVGTDVLFAPAVGEIYPTDDATRVKVERLTSGLCGRSRPGHFAGVTTVVARLFLAAKPHVAVFGEKDYQQLAVIRRMALDLHFDIDIVGAPTVREPDGLAMSSRNHQLGSDARSQAVALHAALIEGRQLARAGETAPGAIIDVVRRRIAKEPLAEIDYVELCDADSLAEVQSVERRALLAVAVRFDGVRLIDNTILEVD